MVDFKKQARDRTKQIMYRGDIISVQIENELIIGVITKVERFGRDAFPDVHMKAIAADWRGDQLTIKTKKLIFNEYRNARILEPRQLRNDVPIYKKALELREKIQLNG